MIGEFFAAVIEYVVAVETILIAVLTAFIVRKEKKRDKRDKAHDEADEKRREMLDKRAELRQRESLLSMELMSATISLGIATAHAVKNDKTNGAMASAVQRAEQANAGYSTFIKSTASDNMHAQEL